MADWSDLKGLTVPVASAKAARYGYTVRVGKHGDFYADAPISADEQRVNVAVNTDVEPLIVAIMGCG